MKPVAIRVINLAARADRREQIAAQFHRLGIYGYTFFEAVDGRTQPPHPLFGHYDPVARARVKGPKRDLKPSQLGCYASHYLLWEECAAQTEPLVVIEDDAIVLDTFPTLLAQARDMAALWPLVWLHDNDKPGRDPALAVGRIGPFDLYKKLKTHYRAVAYLISPEGARALLRYSRTWIYPVDDAMCRFYDHGVESIQVRPHCVTHDNDSASDITGAAAPAPMPLRDRLRRESFKALDQVRRLAHNLHFRFKYRRLQP